MTKRQDLIPGLTIVVDDLAVNKIQGPFHVSAYDKIKDTIHEAELTSQELWTLICQICNGREFPLFHMDGTESNPIFRFHFYDSDSEIYETEYLILECCNLKEWNDFINDIQ